MIPQFDLKIGDTTLDLVELSDAKFILDLRTDEKRSRFISKTSPELAEQVTWIENYKKREAKGEEFYFVAKYQSEPVGTIRLYDLDEDSFCIGSWVMMKGAPRAASIAATILGYKAGFESLNLKTARFDVRKGNDSSFKYHKRWGAVPYKEDDLDVYFTLSFADYLKNFGLFMRFT